MYPTLASIAALNFLVVLLVGLIALGHLVARLLSENTPRSVFFAALILLSMVVELFLFVLYAYLLLEAPH